MSFFETFKRIVQGKPPFEVSDEDGRVPNDPATNDPAEKDPPTPPRGPKVIPEVEVERTTTHTNGSNMQVSCIIQNNSAGPIELDKINLLGHQLELDSYLRPGEERRYNVYSGSRPQTTNYRTAELYYKDQVGDYFCANHSIEYEKEPDNTYVITELKLQRPIRDI